jgi:hypothetical protein
MRGRASTTKSFGCKSGKNWLAASTSFSVGELRKKATFG